MSNKGDFE
jgi:hypothetical protein